MAESNLTPQCTNKEGLRLANYLDGLIQLGDRMFVTKEDVRKDIAEVMVDVYKNQLWELGEMFERYYIMLDSEGQKEYHDFILLLNQADELSRRQSELKMLQRQANELATLLDQMNRALKNVQCFQKLMGQGALEAEIIHLTENINVATELKQQLHEAAATKTAELEAFVKSHCTPDGDGQTLDASFLEVAELPEMGFCYYEGAYDGGFDDLFYQTTEVLQRNSYIGRNLGLYDLCSNLVQKVKEEE